MGYFDNSLQHHGILGQKWGVRRFENEDGTLTAAGRSRYDTDSNGDYKKLSDKQKHAFSAKATAYKIKGNIHKARAAVEPEWGRRIYEKAYAQDAFYEAEKAQKKADAAAKKKAAEMGTNKSGLTEGQKKALKTSAAVAGTLLVAYGGYKLATSPKARAIANDILQGNKAKRLADIDKELASMGPEIVKKKSMDVTKKAVDAVKPNLADKKQADIAKKAVKTVSEGFQSSSPAKFEFEKFMPEKFDFEKFEYENNELVDGLLKKNARMLGL